MWCRRSISRTFPDHGCRTNRSQRCATCRSNAKVGATAHGSQGPHHRSCQESPPGAARSDVLLLYLVNSLVAPSIWTRYDVRVIGCWFLSCLASLWCLYRCTGVWRSTKTDIVVCMPFMRMTTRCWNQVWASSIIYIWNSYMCTQADMYSSWGSRRTNV
jgi:hypothetical protein